MSIVLQPVDQATEEALTQQLVCWAKTATGMIDPRIRYESCASITAQTVGQYVIPGVLCGEYGPLPFTSQDQPIPCVGDSVLRPYIIFATDVDPIDPDTCAGTGPLPPLPTPTLVQVGYIGPTGTSALLEWSADQAPNGVRVAIDPAGTSEIVPAGTSQYEATGLETGVVYTYTITALGDGATSADSAPLTGTVTLLGQLADPASITATATGQTTIEVTWPAVANATRYVVAVQTNSGTEVASIDNAVSPQSVGGLSAGTTYTVTVLAWGQVQSSEANAVLSLESPGAVTDTVTTAPVQLAAPTGVTAAPGPTPTEEIEVDWNTVDFANDYRVEYSADSGATWTDASLPPGTEPPVVIAGLTPGTPYQFRVFAVNTTGISQESAPSATVSATTSLATPTNLNVQEIMATTMMLNWNTVTGAGGYLIGYSSNSGVDWTQVSVGAPPQQITGLSGGTEYQVRIAATSAGGTEPLSPWSSAITTSTPPA